MILSMSSSVGRDRDAMRGSDERSGSLFSYVDLETRVPKGHPLRAIRALANAALSELSKDFAALYAPQGRPSIAPEKLLRALLLQAFYSLRSERQLVERLEFDLLFRWFVGPGVDDAAWDHSVFLKNRDRLLEGEIAAKFLVAIMARPGVRRLLSSEHFSVDGTLIEAWASLKSLRPRDGSGGEPPSSGGRNADANFRGERRRLRGRAARAQRDTAYREKHGPRLRDRSPHHSPCRLRAQPAPAEANRRGLRLDQEHRRPEADQIPRRREGWMGLHPRRRRLQSDPITQVDGRGMSDRQSQPHHPPCWASTPPPTATLKTIEPNQSVTSSTACPASGRNLTSESGGS